jgi:hypothetical protein
MPSRDIRNKLVPILLMNEAIITDTNTDATQLDTADYDGGVSVNVFSSAYSDGSYAVEIHASDTTGFSPSSSTLLSGDSLIPSSTSITISAALADGGTIDSSGFITALRYVKVRIVSTSTSSGATLVILVQNNPEIKPGI